MSIIDNTSPIKSKIKSAASAVGDFMKYTAEKTSDGIAITATLSPKQIADIEETRKEYLSKKPDINTNDVQDFINKNLDAIGIEVYQTYLEQIKKIYKPVEQIEKFDELNRIRYFDIARWVTDSEEKNIDKLVNVYQVLREEDCNIALIYNRTISECTVTLGVVNTSSNPDPTKCTTYANRLQEAICGNFPGVELKDASSKYGIPDSLNFVAEESTKSIAIVSNLASEKSENFISQSMEKLLDGIVPKNKRDEYTIVLLAKPIKKQLSIMTRLFDLYSQLSPYSSWQSNYVYTTSDSTSSSATASAIVFNRSSSESVQVGMSDGNTLTYKNYSVQHALQVIENQVKRIEESSALGMWEFAAYIISESPTIANNVAHTYLALTQGDQSHVSRAAINLWDGNYEEEAKSIILSVQKLQHPLFGLNSTQNNDLLYPTLITPAIMLSGKELAYALNFPRKSISGLPVLECVPFGRNISSYHPITLDLHLGKIYHMHHTEEPNVSLSSKDLTAHTFVTGSTGSGKSNTIYKILYESCFNDNKKFLVIESAKGEYKNIFGGYDSVSVYGTNIRKSALLKINPFVFPDADTTVAEHIDRLIEIFNACWPMYAAMPAVLKEAIESAYVSCGWSITRSICIEPKRFPTFATLLSKLPDIINTSAYSKDTKSDYIGALVTRVKSLTNGINGMIFCADDNITDEQLFENNVIIDISRVGSSETKALIMGMLVIKLQEYRMSQTNLMNSDLRHITVLEEAHNLLRRTSSEQSQESSNLQGKSVEMLANAIAEMRTYGEGFIIADQSPGLLDMSVIRNTNTKIIMHLPDESDRELAGKAAGLNDEQIKELAKLDVGVAAVYQNHWIEPVLCKVDEFTDDKICPLDYNSDDNLFVAPERDVFFKYIINGCNGQLELTDEEVDKLKRWIDNLSQQTVRNTFRKALNGNNILKNDCANAVYCLINGKTIIDSNDADCYHQIIKQEIMDKINVSSELAQNLHRIVIEYISENLKHDPKRYNELIGGVK